MAKALVLDTDFSGDFMKCNVLNGKIIVKDKKMEWEADKTKPISIKGKFGNEDLYILSWKSLVPLQFEVKETSEVIPLDEDQRAKAEVKTLVPVQPQDKFIKTELPELSRATFEMRFLKNMKSYAEGKGTGSPRGKIMKAVLLSFVGVMFMAVAYIVLAGGLG